MVNVISLIDCFYRQLDCTPLVQETSLTLINPIKSNTTIAFMAIGKASLSMAEGFVRACKQQGKSCEGLVIFKHTKTHHPSQHWLANCDYKIQQLASSHPILSQQSLTAGQHLLSFCRQRPSQQPVFLLISGGASALVESLTADWNLAQVQRLNQWLLEQNLSIDQINQYRYRYSQIKNGQLANALKQRTCHCLYLSDVPEDNPAVIGSGLMKGLATSPLCKLNGLQRQHPDLYQKLIKPCLNDYPTSCHKHHILANNNWAKKHIARCFDFTNQPVHIHESSFQQSDHQISHQLTQIIHQQPQHIHIAGGELNLQLPPNAGLGGRTSHLCLGMLQCLQQSPGVFIALASDGDDANANQSACWVDAETSAKLNQLGLNPSAILRQADSTTALVAINQQLKSRACSNNVNDLWVYVPACLLTAT